MLNSLYIKNYRAFNELTIPKLGRVNLITGKNNTGKSSLLEAVALYASQLDFLIINYFLRSRGDKFAIENTEFDRRNENIKTLSTLFTNKEINFDNKLGIYIGEKKDSKQNSVHLSFVYFQEILVEGYKSKEIMSNINGSIDFEEGIEIGVNDKEYIIALDNENLGQKTLASLYPREAVSFIPSSGIHYKMLNEFWDKIALTEKENHIIRALQIIEEKIERISFTMDNERKPIVKLKDNPTPEYLRSMGDGINRILNIILALVNSENGYLLIDEIENGLHYSAQEKLWEVIFKLAKDLKVQVFATTHSNDAIHAFEEILNKQTNKDEGQFIRLSNKNGVIKVVEFSAEELKTATDSNIEIR